MRKPSQAAANCDRFEALIIGAVFSTFSRGSGNYRLCQTYRKVGPEMVMCQGSDDRRWHLSQTEASGGSFVLVPYGDTPFACDVTKGESHV